jgi:predicted NACHT family NTPase
MSELLALMSSLREQEDDPTLRRIYENAAADIITHVLEHRQYQWDPTYSDMTPEEREAYLLDIALDLGPRLLRAALCWALFEAETSTDWLKRHRPGSSAAETRA